MLSPRKAWDAPVLMALVRSDAREAVLATCKYLFTSLASPDNYGIAGRHFTCDICENCVCS